MPALSPSARLHRHVLTARVSKYRPVNIRSSVEDLRSFCRDRHRSALEELTAPEAVRVMTEWYAEQRADGVELDEDGDTLLFQWGSWSWHGGLFGYDLTRQFIAVDAEDDDIWQLSVTLLFPSNSETDACGSGDRWCYRPSDLDEFTRFVESAPATEVVSRLQPTASKSRLSKPGDRPVRFLRSSPLRPLPTPIQFRQSTRLGTAGPPGVLPVLARSFPNDRLWLDPLHICTTGVARVRKRDRACVRSAEGVSPISWCRRRRRSSG